MQIEPQSSNHSVRRPTITLAIVAFTVLFAALMICVQTMKVDNAGYSSLSGSSAGSTAAATDASPAEASAEERPTPGADLPANAPRPQNFLAPNAPANPPTPDPALILPPLRTQEIQHTLGAGESLMGLARKYGVSLQQLIDANQIADPDLVPVGLALTIPIPVPTGEAVDFKVIPDSELVYGPAAADFDIEAFSQAWGGYLATYTETVDDQPLTGAQVIQRVALDFSVNPRLLLAVLEMQSGWVSNPDPADDTLAYPMGLIDSTRNGLYRQSAWTANALNRGFYLWRTGGVGYWLLSDGNVVPLSPTINAGTAGVQNLFSTLFDYAEYQTAVGAGGLYKVYKKLFGNPFAWAVEPLRPPGLTQPPLNLPIESGASWSFTGGPHGGWADGSAWAALDFAPPGEALGCVQSEAWLTAAADGLVVRTGTGAVVLDLDGDGKEQTGWVIFYMHVESRDRVQPGTTLKAGDRIGHPSCEGGVSNGTHVHIARRYNGEWISADQPVLPFVMDGWSSRGAGNEYDGYLDKNGQTIEAYAGRGPNNQIAR